MHEYGTTHSTQVDPQQTTPMLRQYLEVKQRYPGVLLLYQMGEFYETFLEDAIIAARVLEITLTGREAGKAGKIPMAGIPMFKAEPYIAKLLGQQFKVAICEQAEASTDAKGLVTRRVVRVLSAGTLTEGVMLQANEHHWLAAAVADGDRCGLAWCEVSTGVFAVTDIPLSQLTGELERLHPQELLVPGRLVKNQLTRVQELLPDANWLPDEAQAATPVAPISQPERLLCELLDVKSLVGFDVTDRPLAIAAAGLIAAALRESFPQELPRLNGLQWVNLSRSVLLNACARRNLELFETSRTRRTEGSLFSVMNRCQTALGARLLRDWLGLPTQDAFEITARLDTVEELTRHETALARLRELLAGISDLARLAQKVHQASAMPRDLTALANSLQLLPQITETVMGMSSFYAVRLQGFPAKIAEVARQIQQSLVALPPVSLKEGGLFQANAHPDLRKLQHHVQEQQAWLARYEAQERENTGLRGLKLQYTQAFGFFIELPKAQAKQAPAHYQRRQTLTNAERFTTPDLKQHEHQVMDIQTRLLQLEYELFLQLRSSLQPTAPMLKDVADRIAALDVLAGFSDLALRQRYTRPLVDTGAELHLVNARHPVVEQLLPLGRFVANDCRLAAVQAEEPLADGTPSTAPQILLVTGPNMAGKSTYMRQVALLAIMAQTGCFVPADYARIGIVDAVYTRVGAVDDLSSGQSTFMVEMQETAQILHGATARSLVLLDEVGRGTSTYDGVSIAWSVIEYLARHNRCRTLFATHYHELGVLEGYLPVVQNVRVCVAETEGGIAFLHRVEPGTAQKSYGIQVARMAGLPAPVVQRADSLLSQLNRRDMLTPRGMTVREGVIPNDQLSFFSKAVPAV